MEDDGMDISLLDVFVHQQVVGRRSPGDESKSPLNSNQYSQLNIRSQPKSKDLLLNRTHLMVAAWIQSIQNMFTSPIPRRQQRWLQPLPRQRTTTNNNCSIAKRYALH